MRLRNGKPRVDMSQVAAAAVRGALYDGQPPRRRRLSGLRAVAAGAALAVATRVALSKAPAIPEQLLDRMAERGWFDDEDDGFDAEPTAEVDDEEYAEFDDEEYD
jgi:hypothetical protein